MLSLRYDTTEVILKSPEFSDSKNMDMFAIVRPITSGEYKVFKADHWPIMETYVYEFRHIPNHEELKSFHRDYTGLKIQWTDHNGVIRNGFMKSVKITPITIRDDCSYNVSLQLLATEIIDAEGC